jgi:hypothetical protein
MLAGDPLADPGYGLAGQPHQVKVIHHDYRMRQAAPDR